MPYWSVNANSGARLGLRFGVPLIGIDDTLHQRMAHDVARLKIGKSDAAHTLEHLPCLIQPTLIAARQVDLRDIAGNHRAAAETDTSQEHFHLFRRGVLRLVEDHERVIERATAHE